MSVRTKTLREFSLALRETAEGLEIGPRDMCVAAAEYLEMSAITIDRLRERAAARKAARQEGGQ